MEIVLLLIAGVVVYFLYNTLQEYLKNPLHPQQQPYTNRVDSAPIDFHNPYEEMAQVDKVKSSEFGVLAAILGFVVWSDEKICPLERKLLDEILTDMAAESKNPKLSKDELNTIVMEQKTPTIPLDELCDEYVALTKGEYKKRLKVVEFLFVLAYADGVLSSEESDRIVDIAAFFELTNEDFNALYEQFEQAYAQEVTMSEQEARAIFDLQDSSVDMPSKEVLEQKYHELIKGAKQNIFDNKNINKSFRDTSLSRIKEIDKAYALLTSLAKDSQELDTQKSQEMQDIQTSSNIQGEGKTRSGWNF